jgi:hypothetical protein
MPIEDDNYNRHGAILHSPSAGAWRFYKVRLLHGLPHDRNAQDADHPTPLVSVFLHIVFQYLY